MKMFRVVRPVMLMECILVKAKDESDAARRVIQGQGFLFYERSREPSLQVENMKIEEELDLDTSKGGSVFEITKPEDHRSRTLIRAKDEGEALDKAKYGFGFRLEESEYVQTGDVKNWEARALGN
jgi:hypothetical protein